MFDHIRNQNDGDIPITSGSSDSISQGIPVNDESEMCVEFGDVDRYIHGIPYTANGLIACSTGTVTHVSNGLPYDTDGKLVLGPTGLEVGYRYVFDGVDDYATIPDWTPNGLPFSVEVTAVPLTVASSEHYLLATTTDAGRVPYYGRVLPTASITRYYDSAGAAVTLQGVGLSAGAFINWKFTAEGGTYTQSVTGLTDLSSSTPYDFLNNNKGLDRIATISPTGVTSNFHGPIWNLRLTDNSPIQDTDVCMGDGTRYGQLDQPITLSGDFEIEFDWIRQDGSGGNDWWGIVSNGSDDFVRVLDSGSVQPNDVGVRISGSEVFWTEALGSVAAGQHLKTTISRIGNSGDLVIDGVSMGAKTVSTTAFTISLIGALTEGGRVLPTGSALQNLVIKDLTKGLTYTFPLDEGSGTVINNTDTVTGASDFRPISSTTAMFGDGTRYGVIPQITIGAGDDFEISFDWIRQDRTGTGYTNALGALGAASGIVCLLGDTGYTTPNNVVFRGVGNEASFLGALDDVAIGQHVSIRAVRNSNSVELFVDDSSKGVDTSSVPYEIDMIGARNTGSGINAFPANAAIQNVLIHNTTTNERWFFPLDEGSGTVITNTDPVTGVEGDETNEDSPLVQNEDANNTVTNVTRSTFTMTGNGDTSLAMTHRGSGAVGGFYIITGNAVVRAGAVKCQDGLTNEKYGAISSTGQFEFYTGQTTHKDIVFSRRTSGEDCDVDITELSIRPLPNGQWTPDTDWQAVGDMSKGAWTPDTDWQNIPDNSRFYPMNPENISATGELTEVLNGEDGQIENFDADNIRSPFYLGPELVTNGDFAADTDWTKGANATISGGTLTWSGAQGGNEVTYQVVGAVTGEYYEVRFTISDYTAGTVTPFVDSTGTGTARSSVGTFTEVIQAAGGGNGRFTLFANSAFVGDIDNVSVREIL